MFIGRLLMRLLLVPLGGGVAICVATLFVMVAQWNRMAALTADDYSGLTTFFVMVPMLAVGSGVMLWPATLGALLAEVFAIRSWMYHACNGGLSAAVSLVSIGGFDKDYDLSNAPLIAVGAGIVAGFAYWLVAGWSAGFWKPVFAQPKPANAQLPTPAAIAPPAPAAVTKAENEIAGHSRPKDGVAPLAYDPAIRDSTIRLDN
jgi:hypothetical protein